VSVNVEVLCEVWCSFIWTFSRWSFWAQWLV